MMRVSTSIVAALLAMPLGGAAAQTPSSRPVPTTRAVDDTAVEAAITQLTGFLAKYPNSALRPNALIQLGELQVRRADADFAAAQRSTGGPIAGPDRPEYGAAISRYEEIIRRYPDHVQTDAAAYTVGILYFSSQRFADAARSFERVSRIEKSRFRPEAFFRLGDTYFEIATRHKGDQRRTTFAKAAGAYESATNVAPKSGDIYFLSLYKLGWAFYNQATRVNQDEYRKATEIFGRLVAEYDRLTPQQQARLGLRAEALEYMAVAFTQIGGAEAAEQYFGRERENSRFRLPVLRRIAASLRDQGEFPKAVDAFRAIMAQAPTDSGALAAQREIVDIYQNRMQDSEKAQQARLELVERFGPESDWGGANPSLSTEAMNARELALRQSAQYSLALAQQKRGDRQRYAEAAELYNRYLSSFGRSDSASIVHVLYAEALFGQGDYARAGAEYSKAAFGYKVDPKAAQQAGQNAIVAFDSALQRNKNDRGAQDSLFVAVDRFANAFPDHEITRKALITKGRRASEAGRWDVMAETFRTYADRYPTDKFTPDAQKLIGDAMYKLGQYTEAQQQWDLALGTAAKSGRRSLADSLAKLRTAAAASFADTLVKTGDYRRAAEEVYVAFAEKNPNSEKAPEAIRNAIETYLLADSAARRRGDPAASLQARERAIELSARLVTTYPRYQYRQQYQSLRAQLLADVGRRDEAVGALRDVIRDNPKWSGRADAMVRLAVVLDSLGKKGEAATAYEQFSNAFPSDRRAADALYNAAVTYAEAGDNSASARAYATFVSRFPRDSRTAQAQQARVAVLKDAGDTASAGRELARVCARPTEAVKALCAERVAEGEFRKGQALFPRYQALRLAIPRASNLTAAGVQRLSAPKRRLLEQMTAHFRKAIETGNPEWLAAASYYTGIVQWEYGNYLKNVRLPRDLTDAQRASAEEGAAQQAEQYYDAARRTWQALVEKADKESISSVWVTRAKEAIIGNVPATPPTARRDTGADLVVGGMR